jgi:hypothetical protein
VLTWGNGEEVHTGLIEQLTLKVPDYCQYVLLCTVWSKQQHPHAKATYGKGISEWQPEVLQQSP